MCVCVCVCVLLCMDLSVFSRVMSFAGRKVSSCT